jgi:HPt (histidine-containing phosphotransfer) domain-containing protein
MAVETVKTEPILDIDGTLARFGGDKELFIEMSGMLLEDAPDLLSELGRAIDAENAHDVRMRAHALKGLLLGCGGVRAAHIAQVLENAGQAANLRQAPAQFATLQDEFQQLTRALQQFRALSEVAHTSNGSPST